MTWNEWFASNYNTKYNTNAVVRDADGNIVDPTSAIESEKQYLIRNLITFYVDGEEFVAEDGMTWLEWIDTEYNTKNFNDLLDYSGISAAFLRAVCDLNNNRALPEHIILPQDYVHVSINKC
jgi:hypothetical protein